MNRKQKKQMLLLPIVVLLAIVPLIVHVYDYHSNLSQFDWYPASDAVSDFFLFYKSVMIILVSAVMCVILASRYIKQKKEFRFNYQFIPLLFYVVMTLFSSLFSEYQYFSIHGISEMFESLWVVLGYCVIAFYTYQIVQTYDDVSFIMKWFTVGIAIMLLLGMSQASGHDFFGTRAGKFLITNADYWSNLDAIELVFEKGRVFLSLYNPNYVASYFALVLPVLVALLLQQKKMALKIVYAAMILLSVVCFLASGNRSGILAFAAAAVVAAVLLWGQFKKYWKIVLPSMAVVLLLAVAYTVANPYIVEKFARLFVAQEVQEDAISEIVTGDEAVSVTYKGNVLNISFQIQDDMLLVNLTDGSGAEVDMSMDESQGCIRIEDGRFEGFTVQQIQLTDSLWGINLFADGINWYFAKGSDGTYYYYNAYGKLDKINNAPRVAVVTLERLFEERGTIWSKTIPMLKDSLVFGSGADTYTLVYPQDDYVDKTYDGSTTALDVKPHNFYFQMAIQSGIPAAIAVIAMYIWYFITGFQLYRKADYKDPVQIMGAGLLIATFAYMVNALMNDSTVNVSPIFWVMLGMGIAINQMVSEKA